MYSSRISSQIWRSRFGYLAIFCLLAGFCAAQTSAPALKTPLRQASFQDAFSRYRSFPIVSNGYLLSISREATATRSNIIVLTSLQDGKQQKIQFALKQPQTFIEDASIASNGHVLLAGSYVRAGDGSAANFFADVDPAGKNSFLVNLGNYTPERICGTPDGTVWTLGQEWAKEGSADYPMLRSYTGGGEPKGSYFPRSTVPGGGTISFHQRALVSPAFLSCGDRSVGAYVTPHGGTGYWTEVQTGTRDAQSWVVAAMQQSRITGLSLLGKNVLYASFMHNGQRGLFSLSLDRGSSASWNSVPAGEGASSKVARLLGRDGSLLVYFTIDGPVGNPVLYWSQP